MLATADAELGWLSCVTSMVATALVKATQDHHPGPAAGGDAHQGFTRKQKAEVTMHWTLLRPGWAALHHVRGQASHPVISEGWRATPEWGSVGLSGVSCSSSPRN